MKKLFTLFVGILFAGSMLAQNLELSDNVVFYTTTDTISADEEGEYPFTTASLTNGFNNLGFYYETTAIDTDPGYNFAFRKDYTDPETGYTLPHGYYRLPMLDQGKIKLYGGKCFNGSGEEVDVTNGITHLKKVILYCVALPNYKSRDGRFNHQDMFTGRIEAQYMNQAGDTVSNLNYREVKAATEMLSDQSDPDYAFYVYKMKDFLNYDCLHDAAGYNYPRYAIFDQPFKLTVDLTNTVDTKTLEPFLAMDENHNGSEFVNYNVDGMTEVTMQYYFATRESAFPYIDKPDRELRYTSATGYDVYHKKWGDRVAWTEDTPIQISIKKRILIAGIALIMDEDAATVYGDTSFGGDDLNPNPMKAYGVNEYQYDDFKMDINDPWADRRPDQPLPPPPPAGKKGDANKDGEVNVNDITTIAAYILTGTTDPFSFNNADVNEDGTINVNDITGTAAIILGN